jgi:hypothetical protein
MSLNVVKLGQLLFTSRVKRISAIYNAHQYQGEKVPAVVFMGFQMNIINETGRNLLVVLRNNGVVSKSGLATNEIKNKKSGLKKIVLISGLVSKTGGRKADFYCSLIGTHLKHTYF